MMKKTLAVLAAVGVLLVGCTSSTSDTHSSEQNTPQRQDPPKTELTNTQMLYLKDQYVGGFGCFGTTGVYWTYNNSPNVIIPADLHCPAQ